MVKSPSWFSYTPEYMYDVLFKIDKVKGTEYIRRASTKGYEKATRYLKEMEVEKDEIIEKECNRKFKMGENSAKSEKKSTMVVETHTNYINEVKENEEVDVYLSFFDHDKKRIHYKLEMYKKDSNILSATTEVLSLYIDLSIRKVAEFENEKIKIMDRFITENKNNFKSSDLKFSAKLKK